MIQAVLLAAINSGNRKTWQIIVSSIVIPIYYENSTEQEIVKVLGHYVEDVEDDMTFAEMLQTISGKLGTLENENATYATKNKELTKENDILEERLKAYEDEEAINKRNAAIMDEATLYAQSENYEQAIVVLKNVVERTPAMEVLLAECSENIRLKSC